jgi:hypothetical protein
MTQEALAVNMAHGTSCAGRVSTSNPFSTRFVRPGAIPYQFENGQSVKNLIDRLQQHGCWGQIIGPHGSGKSTLLATLLPDLNARGPVVMVELHTNQRGFPQLPWTRDGVLLVVDGYEQLSWWMRKRIERQCRKWDRGLLVTAHKNLGLPTLSCTNVTPAMASMLIDRLLQQNGRTLIEKLDLSRRLDRHRGNLRELFFELYDDFN